MKRFRMTFAGAITLIAATVIVSTSNGDCFDGCFEYRKIRAVKVGAFFTSFDYLGEWQCHTNGWHVAPGPDVDCVQSAEDIAYQLLSAPTLLCDAAKVKQEVIDGMRFGDIKFKARAVCHQGES